MTVYGPKMRGDYRSLPVNFRLTNTGGVWTASPGISTMMGGVCVCVENLLANVSRRRH